jgi:formiminoglutamase
MTWNRAHEMLSQCHFWDIKRTGISNVILGGGHDLAFAHGKSLLQFVQEKGEKLGIINLDAHFDLRPLIDRKGHSGSPFFQLAERFPHDFQYTCAWEFKGQQIPVHFLKLLEKGMLNG